MSDVSSHGLICFYICFQNVGIDKGDIPDLAKVISKQIHYFLVTVNLASNL